MAIDPKVSYSSRVDWWVGIVLVVPALISVAIIAAGSIDGKESAMWIGVGVLVGYAVLLLVFILPLRYEISDKGLEIRHGLVTQQISWGRLMAAAASSGARSSPALSLKRIHILYVSASGAESSVLVSPRDRESFLQSISERSSRHELRDGRLVRIRHT